MAVQRTSITARQLMHGLRRIAIRFCYWLCKMSDFPAEPFVDYTVNFELIPAAIHSMAFVLWCQELIDGRYTKPPRTVHLARASINLERTWATLAQCRAALENGLAGRYGLEWC